MRGLSRPAPPGYAEAQSFPSGRQGTAPMPAPSSLADRHLLFGLLALQMDFVSRDELIETMHAWMLAKEKTLGEILCGRGVLEQEDRADIERLVGKHISKHGSDVQASLAAVAVPPQVRQSLAALPDD